MKGKTLLLLLVLLSAGCTREVSEYSSSDLWYESGRAVDTSKADIFYITSTCGIKERDSAGNFLPRIIMDSTERATMARESEYIAKIFGDSLNVFAPYYHQLTFEALEMGQKRLPEAFYGTSSEICEAFDWYMDNMNGGRPFILAGFSQGGMLIPDILNHMDDSRYSRMVAAYMPGFRISREDMQNPHIRPAQGPTGWGYAVSFNSVSDTSGIFPMTTEGAATCINPVNWRTDSTPAEFEYGGSTLTVSVDTLHNVLVVKGFEVDTTNAWNKMFPKGCLHHWDILFYTGNLRDNAMERIRCLPIRQ